MPTYAILGGTGNTGGELIELLARNKDVVLHVYARSKERLLQAHPVLVETTSPHKIFIGELDNVDVFAQCVEGTSAVFGVVGTNANNPELRLAQDLAKVIVAALSQLKKKFANEKIGFQPPVVAFITSAGMASDPRVHANFPGFLHWMANRVGKYIYVDFRHATAFLQRPENAWIPVIFVCPPGIMPGPSQGEIYVGNEIPKKAPVYVTYADLAKGMVQAVDERSRWVGKEVGVAGAKMPPMDYSLMMYYFTTGMMCVWAPPLWRFGHRRGWWGDK